MENALLDISSWNLRNDQPAGARCLDPGTVGPTPLFDNPTNEKARFRLDRAIVVPAGKDSSIAGVKMTLAGTAEFGTGSLKVNGVSLPLNGEAWFPCKPGDELLFSFECSANSRVVLEKCEMEWCVQPQDLADGLATDIDVLVVTPEYPSEANLYLCAFAHARNRRYTEKGLRVQVLSMLPHTTHQARYTIDGIPVLVGGMPDLERLLLRKQYKVVVTHFVDAHHYRIFDACITGERLVFICHGPLETLFPMSPVIARPYFTPPPDYIVPDNAKLAQVRRYARKENVDWVFVSQWQLDKSQELMEVEFLNAHVIHNSIDLRRFPYHAKTADERKRILVLRRFENTSFHSIDIVVRCILELATRPFFDDLQFEVVGDGSMFDALTEPLKQFPNVKLRQAFVPHDKVAELHARNGIALLPSRHDSQGLAMDEAAASGLVVVGSRVTCVPYFMDEEHNRTLADPENPVELADVIERLYNDPDEYLAISERLSKRMAELCSLEQTVDREVQLIEGRCAQATTSWSCAISARERSETPVLTMGITGTCNEELGKCLNTLSAHNHVGNIEVLLDTRSLDSRTLEIAKSFAQTTPFAIRLLDGTDHALDLVAEARGAYFRAQDARGWVNPDAFCQLVDYLSTATADLVITRGMVQHRQSPDTAPVARFDALNEQMTYRIDDMVDSAYGFGDDFPNALTGTYKTDFLKQAGISLESPAEASLWSFAGEALACAKTAVYRDLDVSRCFVDSKLDCGNEADSSRAADITAISQYVMSSEELSRKRNTFMVQRVIAPAAAKEIVRLDQSCQWQTIDVLVKSLEKLPGARETLSRIAQTDQALNEVLARYDQALSSGQSKPIIDADGTVNPHLRSRAEKAHDLVRDILPFGIIERRRALIDANVEQEARRMQAWEEQ